MKLITVVAQDARNNNVLMVAYANKEALRLTRKTGWMHYWSRSRQKLWKKGETSGNLQKVVSLHYDCDRDAILARVIQTGPACHRNTKTCFSDKYFRGSGILDELWEVFRDRKRKPKKGSYTNKLMKDRDELAKKLIEEASELALAARGRKRKQIKWEAADLLYHTLLTLFTSGVNMEDVEEELRRRRK